MGKFDLIQGRLFSNFKALGSSVRIILKARKKLSKTDGAIYLILVLLPLLSVVFVTNQIIAMTWLICLFIYFPIIEAYAYSIVESPVTEIKKEG